MDNVTEINPGYAQLRAQAQQAAAVLAALALAMPSGDPRRRTVQAVAALLGKHVEP